MKTRILTLLAPLLMLLSLVSFASAQEERYQIYSCDNQLQVVNPTTVARYFRFSQSGSDYLIVVSAQTHNTYTLPNNQPLVFTEPPGVTIYLNPQPCDDAQLAPTPTPTLEFLPPSGNQLVSVCNRLIPANLAVNNLVSLIERVALYIWPDQTSEEIRQIRAPNQLLLIEGPICDANDRIWFHAIYRPNELSETIGWFMINRGSFIRVEFANQTIVREPSLTFQAQQTQVIEAIHSLGLKAWSCPRGTSPDCVQVGAIYTGEVHQVFAIDPTRTWVLIALPNQFATNPTPAWIFLPLTWHNFDRFELPTIDPLADAVG